MNTTRKPLAFFVGQEPFAQLFYARVPELGVMQSLLDLPDIMLPVIDARSGRHEHILVYVEKGEEDYNKFAPAVYGPLQAELVVEHLKYSGFEVLIDVNALHPSQQQYAARHGYQTSPFGFHQLTEQESHKAWFSAVGRHLGDMIVGALQSPVYGNDNELARLSLNDKGELVSLSVKQGKATVQMFINPSVQESQHNNKLLTNSEARLRMGNTHVSHFDYSGVRIMAHIQHPVATLLPQLLTQKDLDTELAGLFTQALQEFSSQIARFL